jgi:hypothetical protein
MREPSPIESQADICDKFVSRHLCVSADSSECTFAKLRRLKVTDSSRDYAFVTEEFIMEGCRLSVFLTMDEARQLCRMNVLLTRKTRAEAAETELNGFLSAD